MTPPDNDQTPDAAACTVCGSRPATLVEVWSAPGGQSRYGAVCDTCDQRFFNPVPAGEWTHVERRRLRKRAEVAGAVVATPPPHSFVVVEHSVLERWYTEHQHLPEAELGPARDAFLQRLIDQGRRKPGVVITGDDTTD